MRGQIFCISKMTLLSFLVFLSSGIIEETSACECLVLSRQAKQLPSSCLAPATIDPKCPTEGRCMYRSNYTNPKYTVTADTRKCGLSPDSCGKKGETCTIEYVADNGGGARAIQGECGNFPELGVCGCNIPRDTWTDIKGLPAFLSTCRKPTKP